MGIEPTYSGSAGCPRVNGSYSFHNTEPCIAVLGLSLIISGVGYSLLSFIIHY